MDHCGERRVTYYGSPSIPNTFLLEIKKSNKIDLTDDEEDLDLIDLDEATCHDLCWPLVDDPVSHRDAIQWVESAFVWKEKEFIMSQK